MPTNLLRHVLTTFLVAHAVTMPVIAQDRTDINDSLAVVRIAPSVWVHVSKMSTRDFGTFTCNGLIYIQGDKAVMMDTPPSEGQTRALMAWFAETFPTVKMTATVVNHFHDDCLAGLTVMHQSGATSYSHQRSPKLLRSRGINDRIPAHTFRKKLILRTGPGRIVNVYPGAAHTIDNIVTYIDAEGILFGGCMVKTLGAGVGNVADANLESWAETIQQVKRRFPKARIVVPGHGAWGDASLLDYTIDLFRGKTKGP